MPPSVVGGMADSGGPSNNWDQCAAGAIRHTYTERIQTYIRYILLQYVTFTVTHLRKLEQSHIHIRIHREDKIAQKYKCILHIMFCYTFTLYVSFH